MTDTPLRFTCVIPTHGRPHLLGDALRSVLTQTDADQLLGAVVVVIDDARVRPDLLGADPQVSRSDSFIYTGVIDVSGMPVLGVEEALASLSTPPL